MHEPHAEFAQLASRLPHEDQSNLTPSLAANEVSQWALSRVQYHRRQIAELESAISTLHSIHNTTIPIRCLPVEVFMDILADPGLVDPKLSLMQVCHYWRDVVLATPQFWANAIANLDLPRRPSTLKAWITRSGSVPLQLNIRTHHLQRWRKHLPKLAHRITDLVILGIGDDDLPCLKEIPRLQWTRLVRFVCDAGLTSSTTAPRFVCNELNFPRLRDLSISGNRLASASTTSSLRTLKIVGTVRDVAVIAPVLEGCPMLEFLTFRNFSWLRNPRTAPADPPHVLPMIDIRCLKQLDISTHMSTGAVEVLSRLILPDSAQILFTTARTIVLPLKSPAFHSTPGIDRLVLGLEYEEWGDSDDDSDFEESDNDSDSDATSEEPTRVNVLRRFVAHCYAEDWMKLRLKVDEHLDGRHNLAHIMGPFRTLPITTLSIYALQEDSCLPEGSMSILLNALPHVRTLELLSEMSPACKLQAATEFLQAQDKRNNMGGLTLIWTIPWLEYWRDDYSTYELQHLAELLQTRRKRGKASLQKLELRHPEYRLITLPPDPDWRWEDSDEEKDVAKYEESVIDELKELVDEVVVLVASERSGASVRKATEA